jgi:hypothetical protein
MSCNPTPRPFAAHPIAPQSAAIVLGAYRPSQFATVRSVELDPLFKSYNLFGPYA